MKKIHFIIMAAVLMFSGCTAEVEEEQAVFGKTVKIRLSTEFPPEIVGTRTMLDENYDVKWHHEDAVFMVSALRSGTNDVKTGKLTNVLEDGYEALFEGEVPEAWLNNGQLETVLYSYKVTEWADPRWAVKERNNGLDIDNITFPSKQPLVSGTFARHYNLSAATFDLDDKSTPLYFHNICGLLNVNIKGNTKIKSVVITSESPMSGLFYITSNKKTGKDTEYSVTVHQTDILSNTITLSSEDGVELTPELQSFYACVLPENLTLEGKSENAGPGAGDYTVTVTTVEDKLVEKTFTIDKGVVAGEITTLGEMDVNYTFADQDGSVWELNPEGDEIVVKYALSGDKPEVTGAPAWLPYEIADGKITFSAPICLGTVSRQADVTISQGAATGSFTFRQNPVPIFNISELYCDADAHIDFMIEKTEYLAADYTFDTPDWLSATKNEAGNLLVSVTANDSGAERSGKINLTVADEFVGAINVIQTGFNYTSLAGDYNFDFWQRGYYTNKAQNKTVTMSVQSDGESYKVIIGSAPSDKFKYSMTMTYTSIGTTPAFLSLICPQDTEYTNNLNGWLTESEVHVAKKSSLSTIPPDGQGQNSIRIDDEGTGCDLVYTVSEGAICFDFVPNALTQELYPEGISGLCFPGMGTNNGTTKLIDLDWMTPLEGQEYLRIVKK